MARRIIRFRGRERKEDVLVLNNRFVAAKGSGTAKELRKRRRR